MTALETLLKNRVEEYHGVLFKTLATRDSEGLDDFGTFLHACHDKIFSIRAQYGVAKYRNPNDQTAVYKYNSATNVLIRLEEMIAEVEATPAPYYIVINMKEQGQYELFEPVVRTVTREDVPLYSACQDSKNHILWQETGKTAMELAFTEWRNNTVIRVHPAKEQGIVWNFTFDGTKYLYARPKMDDNQYFCCKDCGDWFYLSDGEVAWYKTKGFEVPRRCYVCRSKRKAAKSRDISMEDLI